MAILTVLQFLFIGFVLGYLFWNLVQLDRIPPVRGQLPRHPRVSICVPARNEERDIRACLTSLLEQDYPQFEVIAVDDHSDDATPEIIQSLAQHHPHLVFLPSEPLPPDWLGKPHALHQACRRATGEILLFTDADPVFQPWAVNSAVHTMLSRKLDLLTLMPRTEFGSFWERAVQPVIFGFIFALTRVGKIVQADSPKAMGFGAFLMFKREMLEKIGGYERVKGEVLEDVFLARHVKASGGRLLAADGKELFSIRMYHSLDEIWNGWKKNMFTAMRKSVPRAVFHIAAVLAFLVTPFLIFFLNLVGEAGGFGTALSAAAAALVILAGMGLCDQLDLPRRNAFLFPLGAVIMAAIMIDSMIQGVFKRQTEWRGRVYPAGD